MRPKPTTCAGSSGTCPPAGVIGTAMRHAIHRSLARRAEFVRHAANLVRDDLATEAFPFMSFRQHGGRHGAGVSSAGCPSPASSGYEMWVTTEYQRALYELLKAAAPDTGLRLFGGRALNAMRIEKGFGTWAREYRPIYGPFEAGSRPLRRLEEGMISSDVSAAARKKTGRRAAPAVFQGGGGQCRCDRR